MTWDVREAHKIGRGIELRLQPLQLAHVAKRRTKEMPQWEMDMHSSLKQNIVAENHSRPKSNEAQSVGIGPQYTYAYSKIMPLLRGLQKRSSCRYVLS